MTRKDFKLIVEIIRFTPITNRQRLKVAERAAVLLEETNPRFDSEKFIRACVD